MKAAIPKHINSSVNNAPAVLYPVGRSFFQGGFLLAAGITGLLVGGLWMLSVPALAVAQFAFFIVLLIVVSLASHAWWQTDTGRLTWGGESWVWSRGNLSTTGSIAVHLDLQSLLVVTLKDDQGRSVWLWLERASDPASWRAMRRAVYAGQKRVTAAGSIQEGAKAEVSL